MNIKTKTLREEIEEILLRLVHGEAHEEYHIYGDNCDDEIDSDEALVLLLSVFKKYVEDRKPEIEKYKGLPTYFTDHWQEGKTAGIEEYEKALLEGMGE